MLRKHWFFKWLLVLILIMLLVNAYTFFLFIRGIGIADGLFENSQDFSYLNDKNVFYNYSLPSIRFKMIGNDLGILVPSEGYAEMTIIAQKIRHKYQQNTLKTSSSNKGALQFVSRLKRILKKSGYVKKSQKTEAYLVWKTISGWPFSDSLRLINLGEVLNLGKEAKILGAKNSGRGTQLKIEMTLEGGQIALFKPQWYARGTQINGTAYSGKDRHYGEIAAFYLNLILGYNAGPVIVGRKVLLEKEVMAVATEDLVDTFFKAPNGSSCVYGTCYFCRKEDAVCGSGDEIEGALVLLLDRKFKTLPNPWRRTYKIGIPAPWEINNNFCNTLFKDKTYAKRIESLLDIVSVSIFDFLIGNGDRHHFEMFWGESTDSSATLSHSNKIILIDNGKSFGNSDEDYLDILAPLYQCCKIREDLYSTLKKFEGILGSSLDSISERDALHPLLPPSHLKALDRRLSIVLATIEYCIETLQKQKKTQRKVIY